MIRCGAYTCPLDAAEYGPHCGAHATHNCSHPKPHRQTYYRAQPHSYTTSHGAALWPAFFPSQQTALIAPYRPTGVATNRETNETTQRNAQCPAQRTAHEASHFAAVPPADSPADFSTQWTADITAVGSTLDAPNMPAFKPTFKYSHQYTYGYP